MIDRRTESVLTTDQWHRLEDELFDGAGQALTSIRDWARGRLLPPVGAVVMCAQRVLSSVPAGTTFDAGAGPGSLNMLVALVGPPGQGKDRIAAAVATNLLVSDSRGPVTPIEAALGSGEGVAARCAPDRPFDAPDDDPGTPPHPVIFGESEAGKVETLMNRQGSTLRQTIMSIYSGNALGSSNKNDQTPVPRNSYTAGLWIGVQPDKAGALLGGADDGLAHRFIWTELVDPFAVDARNGAELVHVSLPDGLRRTGVTYPATVVAQTRQALLQTVKYGAEGNHRGHRHQTRLKLAAGLALLRSDCAVDLDDWHRAGVLMDYSDTVRQWCLQHLAAAQDMQEVEREQRRERVKDQIARQKAQKAWDKIIAALTQRERVKRADLYRSARRYREEFNAAYEQMLARRIIDEIAYDNSVDVVRGPEFPSTNGGVA